MHTEQYLGSVHIVSTLLNTASLGSNFNVDGNVQVYIALVGEK